MAAPHSMDLHALVREHLERSSPDVLRDLLKTFVEALMSAAAQVLCNAEYGEVSAERTMRAPEVSVHPFRSNPYTDCGVSVHRGREEATAQLA